MSELAEATWLSLGVKLVNFDLQMSWEIRFSLKWLSLSIHRVDCMSYCGVKLFSNVIQNLKGVLWCWCWPLSTGRDQSLLIKISIGPWRTHISGFVWHCCIKPYWFSFHLMRVNWYMAFQPLKSAFSLQFLLVLLFQTSAQGWLSTFSMGSARRVILVPFNFALSVRGLSYAYQENVL